MVLHLVEIAGSYISKQIKYPWEANLHMYGVYPAPVIIKILSTSTCAISKAIKFSFKNQIMKFQFKKIIGEDIIGHTVEMANFNLRFQWGMKLLLYTGM